MIRRFKYMTFDLASCNLILKTRLLILFGLFAITASIKSQDFDLQSYLIGDWYFLSAPYEECDFDSAYNEITFTETYYHFIKECDRFEFTFLYQLENNTITGSSDYDGVVMQGIIEIKDTMHFKIILSESELSLHRIIDSDYKLSEYLHDNIEVSKLKLKLPRKISNAILRPCTNYYYGCLKRRELWLRLERNEINKDNVIQWANDMTKNCDEIYEVSQYENFISRINDIY